MAEDCGMSALASLQCRQQTGSAASPHPLPPPPQISLTAVAIALAKAHQSNMPQAERLLAINLTGLFTNLIIGWGAWTVVRHRTFRTCAPASSCLLSSDDLDLLSLDLHVCPQVCSGCLIKLRVHIHPHLPASPSAGCTRSWTC